MLGTTLSNSLTGITFVLGTNEFSVPISSSTDIETKRIKMRINNAMEFLGINKPLINLRPSSLRQNIRYLCSCPLPK